MSDPGPQDLEYTPSVGTKFHADGAVRRFPGCSIVCRLSPLMPQFARLEWVQAYSRDEFFAKKLAFLPPDSFHMTVFDLICDQRRVPENWSEMIPLDAPLNEVESTITLALESLEFPRRRLRMRFGGLGPFHTTLHVLLDPADWATRKALAGLREEISRVTGVRHPTHDGYRFHVSLAYLLQPLSTQDKSDFLSYTAEIESRLEAVFSTLRLGQPELVLFEDMHDFVEPPRRETGDQT